MTGTVDTGTVDLGALFGANQDNKTFLGLEPCLDIEEFCAPVGIIGVPCATPYNSVGAYCRNAPDALRQATSSLTANLDRCDFDMGAARLFPFEPQKRPVDCGNLPFDENDGAGNRQHIMQTVTKIIERGGVPVLLGGDDSIPIPMIEAIKNAHAGRKFTIVQIDAHIDWRDSHMGERMGLSSTMRRASEMGHIEHIIQIGARGIGSAAIEDYQAALDWGVKFITAHDLHHHGVEYALQSIPQTNDIILCIDADALDPALVPAVIGRAPGGLSYYQASDLVKGVAKMASIAGVTFAEFMPERDVDGIGALTFSRLITTTLGLLVRQSNSRKV